MGTCAVESPLGFGVCCLVHCCCDDVDDGDALLLLGLSIPEWVELLSIPEGVWLWVELWEEL